jgi:hypothetical protein
MRVGFQKGSLRPVVGAQDVTVKAASPCAASRQLLVEEGAGGFDPSTASGSDEPASWWNRIVLANPRAIAGGKPPLTRIKLLSHIFQITFNNQLTALHTYRK